MNIKLLNRINKLRASKNKYVIARLDGLDWRIEMIKSLKEADWHYACIDLLRYVERTVSELEETLESNILPIKTPERCEVISIHR